MSGDQTAIGPDPVSTLLEKAFALHRQGKLAEAEPAYLEALRQAPDDKRVLHLLGLLCAQRGQADRGMALIQRSIEMDPQQLLAYRDLANIQLQAGQHSQALMSLDRACTLEPNIAELHDSRGTALRMLNRWEEALASHDKAIALNPARALTHNNRGTALAELGRLTEALGSFDRAIALTPESGLAHTNRGNVLHKLNRLEEAVESHERAAALVPNLANIHLNHAQALVALGRHREALQSLDIAQALSPRSTEVQFERATTLLALGRYAEGGPAYEVRLSRFRGNPFRPKGRPRWTGREDLAGKTLFVEAEQGLGDTIQFCRYARECANRQANVILAVQESLVRLVSSLDARVTVIPLGQVPENFDYHAPLMSLALALLAVEKDYDAKIPYLGAESARQDCWQRRIGSTGLKIGICWQGGGSDLTRSFPLKALAPIAAKPGIRLISLQKGDGSGQVDGCGFPVENLGNDHDAGQDGFLDTAAAMMAIDLVICCDTSIAHLAGALGRPVWVALKFAADWRYLTGRDDSPWYPTMRLFRQARPGDWETAILKMAATLDH